MGPRTEGTQANSARAVQRPTRLQPATLRLSYCRVTYPRWRPEPLPPPPRPLPAGRPGSISSRQLSRAEGGRRHQPMGKGSVEPPVWAPRRVDQWRHGVWEGAESTHQWGATARGPDLEEAGLCGRGVVGRWRRRRRRVEEDVGHARAGGGAGSERAAGQPGAAAGRLRRCCGVGGPCAVARLAAALPNLTKPLSGPVAGADTGGGGRPQRGPPEEGPTPGLLENISWAYKTLVRREEAGTRSCRKLGLKLR